MRKSQIALGERWKWQFQASRFSGGACPHTTLAARACSPTYITLATALQGCDHRQAERNYTSCTYQHL